MVTKREAAKPAFAERLPERIVESAFSSVKGVTAQGLSDLLAELPAPAQTLAAFLKAHPVETLFIKQAEMGKEPQLKVAGYRRISGSRCLLDTLALLPPNRCANQWLYQQESDRLVIKVKAAGAESGRYAGGASGGWRSNRVGQGEPRPPVGGRQEGARGEALRRHFSVSACVGGRLGESAQRSPPGCTSWATRFIFGPVNRM
ncbi:hypothetical protein [Aeromonas veronii]